MIIDHKIGDEFTGTINFQCVNGSSPPPPPLAPVLPPPLNFSDRKHRHLQHQPFAFIYLNYYSSYINKI